MRNPYQKVGKGINAVHLVGFFYFNSTTKCSQWEWPGQMTMRQLIELVQSISNKMDEMSQNMTQTMRGEMGQCLQAGITAMPRAATNELGGVQRLSGPRWRRVRTV